MKRRGAVAVTVLLAWGIGFGVFIRRETKNAPAQRLAEAALRVSPGAVYYRVEKDGKQIGFASSTIDTTRGGLMISDYLAADLAVGGSDHRATATSDVRLSRTLSLTDFKLTFESDSAPISISGQTAGGDSTLKVVVAHDESAADTQHVRLTGSVILPTVVPIAIALGEVPKVGKSYSLSSFDPIAMAPTPLVVKVEAESSFTVPDSARFDEGRKRWTVARRDSVHAWRISTDGPSAVRAWIDEQGRVVSMEHALGFSLHRTAYEIAFENWRLDGGTRSASGSRDVLETTAIAASAKLEARNLSSLRVRLRGAKLEGFDHLDGGRQALRGDTLIVTREDSTPGAAPYTMPMPLAMRMSFRREISAEPLIQSSDSRIVALARQIRGDTRDPMVAAQRINAWVHDSLKKTVSVTVPSAIQVLESRSGDCNEHTQLFVALSRAVGVPARVTAGLVHVNGKFYYHAWPEVFVGKWIAVDPTFGQFPADAGHLRFVYGGLSQQAELLRLMGTLKIDVLRSE